MVRLPRANRSAEEEEWKGEEEVDSEKSGRSLCASKTGRGTE